MSLDLSARTPKAAHTYARQADSWYVEGSWCSERLFADEVFPGLVIDPCAGRGNIVRAGLNAGLRIEGYDLRDRGSSLVRGGLDFFATPSPYMIGTFPCDCIVSNPPFATWAQVGRTRPDHIQHGRLDEAFVDLALQRAKVKVAVFLPTIWLNSAERSLWIESLPLYREYRVSPRPSCPPGDYLLAGGKAEGGRVDYSWFVFLHGFQGSPTVHFLRRGD